MNPTPRTTRSCFHVTSPLLAVRWPRRARAHSTTCSGTNAGVCFKPDTGGSDQDTFYRPRHQHQRLSKAHQRQVAWSVCLNVRLFSCLFVRYMYLYFCLVYLSGCLSVYLCVCLYVYLSVYLSIVSVCCTTETKVRRFAIVFASIIYYTLLFSVFSHS
jgi:hypothetical protein